MDKHIISKTHTDRSDKIAMARRASMKRRQKGFTLFLALIVSSLLLAISLSLSEIILKQLIFSNNGRESQLAFYAADSGAECALYWDRKDADGDTVLEGMFGTSTPAGDPSNIRCGQGDPNDSSHYGAIAGFQKQVISDIVLGDRATSTFYINYTTGADDQSLACAKVTVAKWIVIDATSTRERTTIDSRGYNAPIVVPSFYGLDSTNNGDTGAYCNATGDHALERAVRVDY